MIFQLRNFGIDLGEVAASLGKVRAKEKEEGKKGEGKKKKIGWGDASKIASGKNMRQRSAACAMEGL